MHEMSLAMEVGRRAAERMERELLPHVTAVGVEVGDAAGVVPDALEFCLESVLAEPPFCGARPVLERCRGDVLRLVWIEVEDDPRPLDGPGPCGGAGVDAGGAAKAGEAGGPAGARTGRGAGAGARATETPLPSVAGPPPGAGDRERGRPVGREGTR